jgi:addiction module HigA family antidote
MGKNMTTGLSPVHPGEFLRDVVLPDVKMSKKDVAEALGISRALLYTILEGKSPVTASVALRLGKFFGNGPELWLNMQSNYDIAVLGKELAPELKAIPTVKAA